MNKSSGSVLNRGCSSRDCGTTGRGLEDLISQFFPVTSSSTGSAFSPRVNIAESDAGYELAFELPGIPSESINIEFQEDLLKISGERKMAEQPAGFRWHRVEQTYGEFSRSFRLKDVDGEKIVAEFNNGMLLIRAPKSPALLPRKIQVKVT